MLIHTQDGIIEGSDVIEMDIDFAKEQGRNLLPIGHTTRMTDMGRMTTPQYVVIPDEIAEAIEHWKMEKSRC